MVTGIIYREPYRGVYRYLRDLGRDFSSLDVAEGFPCMTQGEKAAVTHRLRNDGYIERTGAHIGARQMYRIARMMPDDDGQ